MNRTIEVFPSLNMCPSVATFVEQVTTKLINLNSVKLASNLEPRLQQALTSLSNNLNIVMKSADKVGNTVVMNRVQYEHMCFKILNNRERYGEIGSEEVEIAHNHLSSLINEAFHSGVMNKQTRDFLIVTFPKVPVFNALPKEHKGICRPPGRPIISNIGNSSEKASI